MRKGIVFILAAVAAGAGCVSAGGAGQQSVVSGQAFYRERIAVPPGTQLEVVLEDVSKADAPAGFVASAVIADAGQPPYSFEIRYLPDTIVEDHRYSVRARLTHEGRLLFTTDQAYPVITGGNPTEVRLLLRSVGSKAVAAPAPAAGPLGMLPATFTGALPCADCEAIDHHLDLLPDRSFQLRMSYRGRPGGPFDDIGSWALSSDDKVLVLAGGREAPLSYSIEGPGELRQLGVDGRPIDSKLDYSLRRAADFAPIEPRLMLRGMYAYMADAGIFTECLTGRRLPVATEADNRALEAAYGAARGEPGQPVLVTLEGTIAARMPMEGPGPVPTLVPERFVGAFPGESCGARFATADLRDTYWKLTRLGDEAISRPPNQREPHVVLHGAGQRLAGSDGCNRMVGGYRVEGDSLSFSQVAATMMACPEGMEQARRFASALGATARYRIVGQHLELYDGAGELLARFEAVALR